VVKLVLLNTAIAIARLRMGAAVVADDSVAAVAANPVSWCGLDDGNEKRAILKLTISNSQITFKLGFFADWTDFRHFISFLKAEGEALVRPLPDGC
ncbi:MAG TPA: hypothetical protein VFA15_09250, partial [Nitrososphaera sp.]|nr:hypothetical protein [Nitrososphaera sp.]